MNPIRIKRFSLFAVLSVLFASGCAEVSYPVRDQKIVVDGWIEDGAAPVVIVTATIPITYEYQDISDLSNYVLHWAKVTISGPDGDVILTGRKSSDYYPPYIYTTTKMKGKAGETYRLRVDYGDDYVEAVTTVPQPVPLDGLRVEKSSDADGKFRIIASVTDDRSVKNYYRFFVKVHGKDSTYKPSFMGLFDDGLLTEPVNELSVCRGMQAPIDAFEPYYDAGDSVDVKFVTMDEVSFAYWSDYEDISMFSRNPFFHCSDPIRTNIEGGLGYWAGYGASVYHISIPKK
ncbi:MAG: DUF4249 domain-containing protein [Candidatus Cryptobacteroides sp.]